jgi:hypothetical protein
MAFACVHCNKKYGSSNAKTNHQRVCGLEKALANEREDLANEREENATLREELRQLRQEVNKVNTRPTTINVLCFGSEPNPNQDVLRKILQRVQPVEAIAEYVHKRHFDKPETKNIRIPNKAKNVAQVMKDVDGTKRWHDVSKSEVVDDLLTNALSGFAELNSASFDSFIDQVDNSKEAQERKKRKFYQEQLDSIERTIINHQ